jgi:diadenosine tetraphosphate (Ap4A) HIT family hydrolase
MTTIFDRIVSGDEPSYIVWENDSHLAFLTPFPNTPGQTIVIPRTNQGDYVFDLADDEYVDLMRATRTVADLLKVKLGVYRVALVFEGTGIAYVHAKLYPLHGDLAGQTDVWSDHTEFVEHYRGYLTSIEGPRMSDDELELIAQTIRS